jgi:hypothetical protein
MIQTTLQQVATLCRRLGIDAIPEIDDHIDPENENVLVYLDTLEMLAFTLAYGASYVYAVDLGDKWAVHVDPDGTGVEFETIAR